MRGLVFPDRRAAGALLGKEVATRHFDTCGRLGLAPRRRSRGSRGCRGDRCATRCDRRPQARRAAATRTGDGRHRRRRRRRREPRRASIDSGRRPAVRGDRTSRTSPARALARHDPSGTTPPRPGRPFRHHRRRRHRDRCHGPSRHRRRSRGWRTRVVVATPVAPADVVTALGALADDVVCLESPHPFGSVGRWYRDFAAVNDAEVAELLAGAIHRDDC